jgi:hypothetical protein
MPGFVDVTGWSSRDVQRLGHADDDYEDTPRKAYKARPQQTFTAEDVWALATAADRINEGYFKEDVYEYVAEGSADMRLVKTANKSLVKAWLRDNDFSAITAEDREAGKNYRRHFTSYTMLALAGGLNDFQQQAYKIATIESFTGRNMLEFAIVSCLPSIARRDAAKQEIKREVYASEAIRGSIGEVVVGDIVVVDSRYSQQYEKYRIQARMGESFIDFWFGEALVKGESYRIKGKIKALRDDKTTQLNFVKKIG